MAASPLNAVKLELAFVLVLAVLVFLLAPRLSAHLGAQIALLSGFGFAAMAWIVFRVRRVLASVKEQQEQVGGQKQEQ